VDSVRVSLSKDGADLFKDRTHVSAGIKISDYHCVHPNTKKPHFVQDDGGKEKMAKIPSSEIGCILLIADARKKKRCMKKYFVNFINGEIAFKRLDFQHQMVSLPCILLV